MLGFYPLVRAVEGQMKLFSIEKCFGEKRGYRFVSQADDVVHKKQKYVEDPVYKQVPLADPRYYEEDHDDESDSSVPESVYNMLKRKLELRCKYEGTFGKQLKKWMMMEEDHFNYYMKWAEDIAQCIVMMMRASGKLDHMIALTVLLKARLGDNALFCIDNMEFVHEMFSFLLDSDFQEHVFEQQSENNTEKENTWVDSADEYTSSVRYLLDNYENLKNRKLFKKSYKVIGYLMALTITREHGIKFSHPMWEMLSNEYSQKMWGPDFLISIIDLIVFIMERGLACFKTGSMEPIMHDGTKYDAWFEESRRVIMLERFLNNPGPHGICLPEFLSKVDNLILQGTCMKRYVDKIDHRFVCSTLLQLETIKHNQVGYDAALRNRRSPLAVMITGASSVAKSSLVHILYVVFCKIFNLPTGPEYKYTRNAADKHWNNFRTYKHTTVFDDVAFLRDGGMGEIDPSLMEILLAINNIAWIPPQASLEDKGKTPFWAELALFTTNTPHLNANAVFSCPLAILRRMGIIIDIEPKDEYRKEHMEAQFIDPAKLPTMEGDHFPDYWIIRAYRPVPVATYKVDDRVGPGNDPYGTGGDGRMHQQAKFEFIRKFDNIYDFIAWFTVQAKKHRMNQEKYIEFTEKIIEYTPCEECFAPAHSCACCPICKKNKYTDSHDRDCVESSYVFELQADDQIERIRERLILNQELARVTNQVNNEMIESIVPSEEIQPLVWWNPIRWWLATTLMFWWFLPFITSNFRNQRVANTLLRTPGREQEGYALLASNSLELLGISKKAQKRILIGLAFVAGAGTFCAAVYGILCLFKRQKTAICELDWCILKGTAHDIHIPDAKMDPHNAYKHLREKHLVGTEPVIISSDVVEETNEKVEMMTKQVKLIDLKPPTARDFERPNAWPKNNYELSRFELTPLITSWAKESEETIINIIFGNMRRIKVIRDHETDLDSVRVSHAQIFCVNDHTYLMNKHTLGDLPAKVRIWRSMDTSITTSVEKTITHSQVHFAGHDLAFVFLPYFEPMRDLRRLFAKVMMDGAFEGVSVGITQDGKQYMNKIHALQLRSMRDENDVLKPMIGYFGIPENVTKNGDCGMPVIRFTSKGPIIVGIHILGREKPKAAGIEPVIEDVVSDAIKAIHIGLPITTGQIVLSRQSYEVKVGPVPARSPVNFIEHGRALVITGLEVRRPKYKTNIMPSMLQSMLLECGIKSKYNPPEKLDKYHPWYLGMKSRVETAEYFDRDTLQLAAQAYLERIIERLPKKEYKHVHLYDLHTAINGMPGVAHIHAIDWTTSAGFPYNIGKKEFRIPIDEHDLSKGFKFNEQITQEINEILHSYAQGITVRPVFKGSPKDEVISDAKNEIGKSRIFLGSQLAWTISMRVIFLWVARIMQNNPYVFETAAAMNNTSDEWEVIFQYLTQHSDKRKDYGFFNPELEKEAQYIAGDYIGFDTYDDVLVMWYCFWVLIKLANHCGADPVHIQMMWCAASDATYCIAEFWGIIIMFLGCTPSGFNLTLLINSIKNSLYMRCTYLKLNPLRECKSFDEFVALMTMGDDNVAGVSENVPFFNHTSISEVFASVGIGYTMAEKDASSVPYIPISDVTFLKRRWRWDDEYKCHVCPISEDSIIKSLSWRMESAHVSPQDHAIDVIGNAMREYSKYGRFIFEEKRSFYKNLVEKLNLKAYVQPHTFLSFDHFIMDWCDKSDYVDYDHPWMYITGAWERVGLRQTKTSPSVAVTAQQVECMSLQSERMGFTSISPGRSPKLLFSKESGRISRRGMTLACPLSRGRPIDNRFSKQETKNEPSVEVTAPPTLERSTTIQVTPSSTPRGGAKQGSPRLSAQAQINKNHQTLMARIAKLLAVLPADLAQCLLTDIESYVFDRFKPQSEESVEGKEVIGESQEEQEATIEFIDQKSGDMATLMASKRVVFDKSDDDGSLTKFLGRPLLINSYLAQLADTFGTTHTINPWNAFCTNALNEYKLNNYAFLRGNLHLKFVISGTNFIYGCEGVFYAHMQDSPVNSSTAYGNSAYTGANGQHTAQLSQLPHIYMTPHDSKGGELVIPFLYNRNWLTIPNGGTEFNYFGSLIYYRMVQFQSANGGTSSGITINTFAWLEDVELSGPTTTLAFQSKRTTTKKDEYGMNGTVSGPASAVAALSSWFTDIPVIGPFATATQQGAKAIAAGAAALGYTNEPEISSIHSFRPVVNPPLASSEISFPIEKLTIDPKNELTIDNGSIGGPRIDELNMKYLLTKEAYLGNITWAQTSAEGTGLGSFTINPGTFIQVDTSTYNSTYAYAVYPLPIAYFSQLFQFWRGDIILRFKVIASQYHKGRLRIIFDPSGHGGTTVVNTDSLNAVYSEIIDIGAETDVEVRIPYMQAAEWSLIQPFQSSPNYTLGSIGGFNHLVPYTNGTVVLRVMNELTAPVAGATATIMVFARAAENFELNGPATQWDTGNYNYSLFTPQSMEVIEKREILFSKPSVPKPERYLTNFGEGYVSLRQVLRRFTTVGVDTLSLTAAKLNVCSKTITRFPSSYGWDPNGNNSAHTQLSVGTANFSYCKLTPLTWVMSCFLGVRGSVNWLFTEATASAQGAYVSNDIRVTRAPSTSGGATSIEVTAYSSGTISVWANYYDVIISDSSGASFTDTRVQPTAAVCLPNYNNYFFSGTQRGYATNPALTDGSCLDIFGVTWSVDLSQQSTGSFVSHLISSVGIGADFNVVGFFHTPVIYVLVTNPTPN